MLCFQIGPLNYHCDCAEDQLITFFPPSFHPFRLQSTPEVTIPVKLRKVKGSLAPHLEPGQLIIRAEQGIVDILNQGLHATCNLTSPAISIEMGDHGNAFMPLRFCSALLLPAHRCLMLHSATVVKDGQAYIFSGESGAGKTTISNISHQLGHQILTDDTTALGLVNGAPYAWGTPFCGTGNHAQNNSTQVRGLFFLTKANTNTVTRMDRTMALRRLMRNTLLNITNFSTDSFQDIVVAILDTSLELTSRLPIYSLEFKPDQELWSILP